MTRLFNKKLIMFNSDIIKSLLCISKESIIILLYLLSKYNKFENQRDIIDCIEDIEDIEELKYIVSKSFKLSHLEKYNEKCISKYSENLYNIYAFSYALDELTYHKILIDRKMLNKNMINYGNKLTRYNNYFYIEINSIIPKFIKLQLRDIKVLLMCIYNLSIENDNLIRFNSDYKNELSEVLGYSLHTLNKSIGSLKESQIFISLEKTKYIINPNMVRFDSNCKRVEINNFNANQAIDIAERQARIDDALNELEWNYSEKINYVEVKDKDCSMEADSEDEDEEEEIFIV